MFVMVLHKFSVHQWRKKGMRNVQKSAGFTLWALEGRVWEPRVASLFTWTRIQEPCVQSWRMEGFFLFPPAPQSFAGFPPNWVLLHVLNIWIMLTGGGSEGVCALLDVELCISGCFCVGSWMQNNKNSVQLEATMSVVACLNVKHWVKRLNFYWCRSVKNIENYEGSKMFLLLISHLGRCHLAAGHSKNIFTFLHSFILA